MRKLWVCDYFRTSRLHYSGPIIWGGGVQKYFHMGGSACQNLPRYFSTTLPNKSGPHLCHTFWGGRWGMFCLRCRRGGILACPVTLDTIIALSAPWTPDPTWEARARTHHYTSIWWGVNLLYRKSWVLPTVAVFPYCQAGVITQK